MKEADRQAMNNITVGDMNTLNVSCDFVAIIGNGTLCAVVPEEEAEKTETERCDRGY